MDQEKACTACRKNLVPREKGPEKAPQGEDTLSGADRALSNLDLIEQVCRTTTLEDPLAIACRIMQRPQISLHGPEHHFLVPAVLIAAYYNHRGSPEKKDPALRQARKRAEAVQPAFCGTHGTCGAAIGTGIFMSLITHSGPLKKELQAGLVARDRRGGEVPRREVRYPSPGDGTYRVRVRHHKPGLHGV